MRVAADSLDARSRELLTLLIQTHMATGEPVGSRTVSKLTSEGLSAATVRNIMADLEDAGYLEQPHTSAGRVPTGKAYRFYVDHVLRVLSEGGRTAHLSQSDEHTIQREMLSEHWPSADQIMARASHLLSDLSENVGIVISPSIARDPIRRIEFLRLTDGRVLVITVSRAGLVKDRLVRVAEDFEQAELDRTARYLNENFSGLTLAAIRAELLRRMQEEKNLYDRLLQNAILICDGGLGEGRETETEVFVDGASNILKRSDFADVERLRELLRLFEEKRRLVQLLNECVSADALPLVGVRIGTENSLPGLHSCAVVTASYSCGSQVVGTLGVVGPMRMEYARTINVVSYVARMLERVLADAPSGALN
jgi:heat-inducible transcriptional repressor